MKYAILWGISFVLSTWVANVWVSVFFAIVCLGVVVAYVHALTTVNRPPKEKWYD